MQRHHRPESASGRNPVPHSVAVCVAAGIDHPVGVQDEEPHVGVVDRGLGARLPGLAGLFIVGEGAHELDLGQVAEDRSVEVAQLAADDEVKKLSVSAVMGGVRKFGS